MLAKLFQIIKCLGYLCKNTALNFYSTTSTPEAKNVTDTHRYTDVFKIHITSEGQYKFKMYGYNKIFSTPPPARSFVNVIVIGLYISNARYTLKLHKSIMHENDRLGN